MSIYSVKLAHVQVVINCPYSVAQMCTHEHTLAHILGTLYLITNENVKEIVNLIN